MKIICIFVVYGIYFKIYHHLLYKNWICYITNSLKQIRFGPSSLMWIPANMTDCNVVSIKSCVLNTYILYKFTYFNIFLVVIQRNYASTCTRTNNDVYIHQHTLILVKVRVNISSSWKWAVLKLNVSNVHIPFSNMYIDNYHHQQTLTFHLCLLQAMAQICTCIASIVLITFSTSFKSRALPSWKSRFSRNDFITRHWICTQTHVFYFNILPNELSHQLTDL